MATVPEVLADLQAEYEDLHAIVSPLAAEAPEWDLATPAVGWAVRDHIGHLAFFDEAGRTAMVDPERFSLLVDDLLARGGDPMEDHLKKGRSMPGGAVLRWWEEAHSGMIEVFAAADPGVRVPWFGPPMGVLSFVSARLMETWAHGQDVADALGHARAPTDRLRHVAHLGVRARPFSYAVRGREVPPGRIDIALVAPSGEEWTWAAGEDGADAVVGSVTGPALDFCLVVTQRRNLADTSLVVTGEAALDWMGIAQAFAGPPGAGRQPLGSR
jgi:uncharacterized protein (TIGR03084 family)